jgi:serine/threonine-protein kinase RsbW
MSPEIPVTVARLDPESGGWPRALADTGPQRDTVLARPRELLVRLARGEVARRGPRPQMTTRNHELAVFPAAIGLRTTEVTYPGGTEHIRAVRFDLRTVLDECPRADDVILCASELAANAAQHSRSRLPGGTFTVRAAVSPGRYARVEVQDNGGPWNQAVTGSARYHGLDIIRAVAEAWGIDGGHATHTVWARFDWPEQL